MAFEKNNLSGVGESDFMAAQSDAVSEGPMITNENLIRYAETPELPSAPEMIDVSDQSESNNNLPSLFTLSFGQNTAGIVPPLAPVEAQMNAPKKTETPAPQPIKKFTLNTPVVILGVTGIIAAAWYFMSKNKKSGKMELQAA